MAYSKSNLNKVVDIKKEPYSKLVKVNYDDLKKFLSFKQK
jgi:hypothetical protein